MAAQLDRLLVGPDNFADRDGVRAPSPDRLALPRSGCRLNQVARRLGLRLGPQKQSLEQGQPEPAVDLSPGLPLLAVGLLACDLTGTLVLLAVFCWATRLVALRLAELERGWARLDCRMGQWRRAEPDTSPAGLRLLLSIDGPWRGEY